MPARRLLMLPVAVLAAALPTLAVAADPGTGTISTASPRVEWKGSTTGGFATTFSQIFVNVAGEQEPCQAPSCDEFALELADAGDLTVAITADGSTISYVQVVKPDGSAVFADGIDPEGKEDNTTTLKIKKAPKGAYKVQTAQNSPLDDGYSAFAQLGTAAPAPAPAAPAATPAPAPTSAPAPARPTASLTVKAGRLSARTIAKRRRLSLGLSTTSPVTDVKASLARGSKVVATGALARLDSTGRITLKLKGRSFKAGTYSLVVAARDGAATVGTRIALKIARK